MVEFLGLRNAGLKFWARLKRFERKQAISSQILAE